MKAGAELDALITIKVMGLELRGNQTRDKDGHCGHFKQYSIRIEAAWDVVEKLLDMGFYPDLVSSENGKGRYWYCLLHTADDENHPDNPYKVKADTAPEAVCLAALKAVGVEV